MNNTRQKILFYMIFILGLGITISGIYVLLIDINNGIDHSNSSIFFLLFGLSWIIVGGHLLLGLSRKEKLKNHLMQFGEVINGNLFKVIDGIQKIGPFSSTKIAKIVCIDTSDGSKRIYNSHDLDTEPTVSIGTQIGVYIDPNNPDNYFVKNDELFN